jgi:hypothetical protein
MNSTNTRSLLKKLADAGDIAKVGYGLYVARPSGVGSDHTDHTDHSSTPTAVDEV